MLNAAIPYQISTHWDDKPAEMSDSSSQEEEFVPTVT